MTYCVGLRTNAGVFIGADTVMSTSVPLGSSDIDGALTSVGELQGGVGKGSMLHVSESGQKLHVGSDSVLGFAGHVDTARALIQAYLDARVLGDDARNAVTAALRSVTPSRQEAEVLIAFFEANVPRLLLVNTLTGANTEMDGLVQLGSHLPAGQHSWTEKVVRLMLEQSRWPESEEASERIFTMLVAMLQSYGVHDYLPQHGVGGAFLAAWVTPSGARWQGDHLYLIHGAEPAFEDPMCATMVRGDVACLVNNQAGATKILLSKRAGESADEIARRASEASAECLSAWDSGAFDYFVSINSAKHIVTVVQMLGRPHHALISLHATHIERRLGIVWTGQLLAYTNTIAGVDQPDLGHMTIRFLPFIPISDEETQERDEFAWRQFVDWDGEPRSAVSADD